ncbi:MAG: hypothetical protein AB8G15_18000 [Saprospiraceae bacterium]
MYTNSIAIKEERKDKKRGMLLTVLFHTALVALAVIPFLTPSEPEMPDLQQIVVVDYTNFEMSSKKSAKGKKVKKAPTKKKTVEKETKIKKTPKPTPKPAPTKKPMHTTTEPNPPITPPTKTKVETTPIPKPAPVETVPEEVIEETPIVEETPSEETMDTGSNTEEVGTAEETGNNDNGTTDAAGKAEEGTAGEGEGWVDLGGDGIFNRKVVYRADVKKLTKEEGVIVVKLCISQNGGVVFAEYDEENSTIKNKAILKNAELTARKYKFGKDYTAPYKQCGKLTFIFDLEG